MKMTLREERIEEEWGKTKDITLSQSTFSLIWTEKCHDHEIEVKLIKDNLKVRKRRVLRERGSLPRVCKCIVIYEWMREGKNGIVTQLRTLEISTVTQTKRRREKEERANGMERSLSNLV